MNESIAPSNTAEASDQYSLAKILGIWAAAALPMAILSWYIFPLLAPDFETDPLGSSVSRVILLTLGEIWLFLLSMIIVRQEEGNLNWATKISSRVGSGFGIFLIQ